MSENSVFLMELSTVGISVTSMYGIRTKNQRTNFQYLGSRGQFVSWDMLSNTEEHVNRCTMMSKMVIGRVIVVSFHLVDIDEQSAAA